MLWSNCWTPCLTSGWNGFPSSQGSFFHRQSPEVFVKYFLSRGLALVLPALPLDLELRHIPLRLQNIAPTTRSWFLEITPKLHSERLSRPFWPQQKHSPAVVSKMTPQLSSCSVHCPRHLCKSLPELQWIFRAWWWMTSCLLPPHTQGYEVVQGESGLSSNTAALHVHLSRFFFSERWHQDKIFCLLHVVEKDKRGNSLGDIWSHAPWRILQIYNKEIRTWIKIRMASFTFHKCS